MSLVADIAAALGVSQKALRAEVEEGIVADAVLAIVLARFWPNVPVRDIAKVAGVDEDHMRLALARRQLASAQEREQLGATAAAKRRGVRTPVPPEGEAPSPEHLWCKRGRHWVHRDDMGRNSHRESGYGDWCRPCWRAYWHENVRPRTTRAARQ